MLFLQHPIIHNFILTVHYCNMLQEKVVAKH